MNTLINRFKAYVKRVLTNAAREAVLPLEESSSDIYSKLSDLKKQQETIPPVLHEIQQQFFEVNNLLSELKMQNAEDAAVCKNHLQQIDNHIIDKPVGWNNPFEKSRINETWGNVMNDPEFESKFIRLINGLDAKSVQAITRILSRQQRFLHNDNSELFFYTREEQEELRLLQEHFDNEIFKVSDSLYAYRNYLLPINHFESSVFYFRHGIDALETIETVKGKTVIDVGGFIGDSVLVLSELNPRQIISFESNPESVALLNRTLDLNDINNVLVEECALGDFEGSMTMHINGSMSTTINAGGTTYEKDISVPVTTFDQYVEEHNLRDIALIKVDIEGGEPAFIAGAKNTICEQKPILLLSIYHNAHDFFELKPLIESWNLGYRFSIHKPTYGNATDETLLLAEVV